MTSLFLATANYELCETLSTAANLLNAAQLIQGHVSAQCFTVLPRDDTNVEILDFTASEDSGKRVRIPSCQAGSNPPQSMRFRAELSINQYINPLKKKRRLLNLKTKFVPRSKHFSSRL